MNVLVTVTIEGNLADVRTYCNARGWADYLIQAQPNGGRYITMLLRMPEEVRHELAL